MAPPSKRFPNENNDQLLIHLAELDQELEKAGIPLILGGGMGLYVRAQFLRPEPSARYPFPIEVRSTNDLDLFLTSELIADLERIKRLREIIGSLGYVVDPKAKNFQFIKDVDVFGQRRQVRVELLAAPPVEGDRRKVEIKPPRIKPVGVSGIHAYLTNEAAGIEIGAARVSIPGGMSGSVMITIPSAFNYLILKLHAFDDRKLEKDPKSDEGRHHAFDVFATVTRMNEEDWIIAEAHARMHGDSAYVRNAARIRTESFGSITSMGLLRLQENIAFQRGRDSFRPFLERFIKDLGELFP